MKKMFYLWLMCICILLSGCTEEKESFEHYDLKDKDLNFYMYNNDHTGREIYVLADITPDPYESVLTGLFYKIGDHDYILLETLESSQRGAYKKDSIYQFYDNKLYGVGNGNSPMIFEIELKGKESKIKELEFEINGKTNPFLIGSIRNIDHDFITFSGNIFIGEHSEYRYFDCSLKNYECSIKDS